MSNAPLNNRSTDLGFNQSQPVAVIDIGATNVRMAIAEIGGQGKVRHLANQSMPISIGKDTFGLQRIRKNSMEECVRVLSKYRDSMFEFGITRPEQIRVVATSAVREATNKLAFIDRVYIATGLVVEALDEAEVNRITYMGIQPLIQSVPELASSKTVVVEIGSGSTEVLVVRGGHVLFSNSYRLARYDCLSNLIGSIRRSESNKL